MTHNKAKELKDLTKLWYKKLEKAGFEDIEQDEQNLKAWASNHFKANYDPIKFAAKEEYYRMAGHFLHDHTFSSSTEQLIWKLHAEGFGVRSIAKLLLENKFPPYNKDKVNNIIKKLSEIMVTSWQSKNRL